MNALVDMLPFKYTYLLGSSLFFIYWFFLFFKLKNHRKQLILFSIFFGLTGLASGFLFTRDWWQPETILGYRFSLEDIILGFTNGGIASTFFLLFYREKEIKNSLNFVKSFFPFFAVLLIVTILVLVFSVSSFLANIIGLLSAILIVLFQRKDLIFISLLSGFSLVLLAAPVYLIMVFLSPGWVEKTWMLNNLSGIFFLNIPIEDYIWYFFVGSFISILYPYSKNIYYETN